MLVCSCVIPLLHCDRCRAGLVDAQSTNPVRHLLAFRLQLHGPEADRRMFFSNRSVKQREDILTNKLAENTHAIARKTQIAQCAAVNNWGDI